jgi:GNAT superfamily N-acetyltransferase
MTDSADACAGLTHYARGKTVVKEICDKLPSMSPNRFRWAEPQDLAAIVGVINAAFRNAEAFLIDRDRITHEAVEELFRTGKFLLVENDAGLLGCLYLELRGERAYLGLLSVDPLRQKAGLGSSLMTAAEEYCAKAGCRFMDLRIVNVRKELPGYYRRRGYVENGTESFPSELNPKVACHFVKMSKPLM